MIITDGGNMATKKVNLKAKCASIDIELTANIKSSGLSKDEFNDVVRKLKHLMSASVSKLPFSHTYPHEMDIK